MPTKMANQQFNILALTTDIETLKLLKHLKPVYNFVLIKSEELPLDYVTEDYVVILHDLDYMDKHNYSNNKMIPTIYFSNESASLPLLFENSDHAFVDFLQKPLAPIVLETKIRLFADLYKKKSIIKEQQLKIQRLSNEVIINQSEFLTIASHELNTPITSLKFYLQILMKTLANNEFVPAQKIKSSLNSSLKQVERLIKLVQVLLDASYMQSGKIYFSFEEFNLSEVIEEVLERNREYLASHFCELELMINEDIVINGDKNRLEQCFTNLLTNAVKYAPGLIKIKLLAQNNIVSLTVSDNGPGIPNNKLNAIFDKFERAANDIHVRGLGLGLYIVKQIIEGHKGHIEVNSKLSMGSSFTVTFPMDCNNL